MGEKKDDYERSEINESITDRILVLCVHHHNYQCHVVGDIIHESTQVRKFHRHLFSVSFS